MKVKIFLLVSLLSVSAMLCAAENEQLKLAADQYAAGEYAAAGEIYKTLLESCESADLYYNYGNTCFKLGDKAQAILCYERALRLNPYHTDAKHNLQFVNAQITDKIEPLRPFFVVEWIKTWRCSLAADSWGILSIVCFILVLVSILLLLFSRNIALRKTTLGTAIFFLLFTLITMCFAFQQKRVVEQRREAIVMSGSVTVKSAPDDSGTELFVIHEGTKVTKIDQVGLWCQIEIADGQKGWLLQSTIEAI